MLRSGGVAGAGCCSRWRAAATGSERLAPAVALCLGGREPSSGKRRPRDSPKPGGFRATQRFLSLPNLRNSASTSRSWTSGCRLPGSGRERRAEAVRGEEPAAAAGCRWVESSQRSKARSTAPPTDVDARHRDVRHELQSSVRNRRHQPAREHGGPESSVGQVDCQAHAVPGQRVAMHWVLASRGRLLLGSLTSLGLWGAVADSWQ